MTFSKVVSGMGGAPSGLLKSGTNIASKSGKDWVSYGGRRAALDPAITFWAPLNRDTQDELGAADTFTRASDGLYLPYNGADWRIVGQNVPRHENGQLLMEPAATNVFLNSDAAVTQTIILPLGDQTLSVRGSGSVVSSNNGGTATGHGTATDGTPVTISVTTAGGILFTVSGSPTYVQVESGRVVSSPIITGAASATRAIDELSWAAASSIEDAQGMCLFKWRVPFNYDQVTPGGKRTGLLVFRDDRTSRLYWEYNVNSFSQILCRDSTGNFNLVRFTNEPVKDAVYPVALRWSGIVKQLGFKNGSGWVWGTEDAYSAFSADVLEASDSVEMLSQYLSELVVYNEDRGRAWIEANY